MAEITTRSSNRAALTHQQVDSNFINLNTAVIAAQQRADEAMTRTSMTPSVKETEGRVRIAANSESDDGVNSLQVNGDAVITEGVSIGGKPGFESFRVVSATPVAVAGGRIDIAGGNATFYPRFQAVHPTSTDSTMHFGSQAGGGFRFFTQGVGGLEQFRITHAASAMSYANVSGSAAGFPVMYTVGGTLSSITVALASKGNSSVQLQTNGFTQFTVYGGAGITSNIQAGGGTGFASPPTLSVVGTIADADLRLIAKGTGRVRFGVYTASTDLPVTGYITIRDESGTDRRLAVV